MGIKVVKPYENEQKMITLGSFRIQFFDVEHDVPTYGAYVEESSMGKLLFLTDLEYCKYNFSKQKINHIICECNYSKELVDENYEHSLRNRVLKTHMELETTLNLIRANDNPTLLNVVLIHLSDKNADSAQFQQKIEETIKYGANVYVAEKGLKVDLSLCPF